MPPAVEIRALTKRYGGRAVVDDLDLLAGRGRVTAVLGPNGAGKTTIVECCEGLRRPDSGRLRVLGLDPEVDGRLLRERVGVMLQDGGLPTGARAMEVLRHVAAMHRDPWPVGELAARLGVDGFAGTTVRRLSGGQRQRLAMATALVGRPDLVFLDEPTAGMDPQARLAVWTLVRELRAGGTSIVLTTHDMAEAAELADHVVIVDHGRAIAEGSPAELTGAGTEVLLRTGEPLTDAQCDELAALTPVRQVATGVYLLPEAASPGMLAAVTTLLAGHDVLALSVQVGHRTLHDVFLDLTGRSLR